MSTIAITGTFKSAVNKNPTHDSTAQMLHLLKCHPPARNSLQALRHSSPYRCYRSSHFSSRRAERGPLAAGYRKNIALRKIPIPTHLSQRLNLQLPHSLHSHTSSNDSHTTDAMAELTHPTIKDGKIFSNKTVLNGLPWECFSASKSVTNINQAGSARSATCGLARP